MWVGLREVLSGCGDDASLGAIFCIMSVLTAELAGIGEWDCLATIHRYFVLLLTVFLKLIAIVLVGGVLVAVGVGVAFHVAEVAELTSIVIVLLIAVIVSIGSVF